MKSVHKNLCITQNMAVLDTSMESSTRENSKKKVKNNKKKVLLVAQELKLARILAGNNKVARDRALKSLKKWFQNRALAMPFSEDDFLRLWKGLFYSMWMSDKPLIQEDCAENISSLVHSLPLNGSLLFYKAGMRILMNEWFGIDQLRLDKFLMFVRRLLRQILFAIRNVHWSPESIQKFSAVLSETILDTKNVKPVGLLMHFVEIFLEELAKVSNGDLPPQHMTLFVEPFIKQLAFTNDYRIMNHICKHVFIYLMRQSDLGLEYDEKYKAWGQLGFPGSIDAMKKVEDADFGDGKGHEKKIDSEKVYDPRAGRVDVDLPQLKFHGKAISKAVSAYIFLNGTNSKSRKCLTNLSELFKKFASGVYPLGVKKVKLATDNYDTRIKKAVNRLVKFEKKTMGKKNKKRKLQPEVDDAIELRGGKKIKLDEGLRQKVAEELENIMSNPNKRKKLLKTKRKNVDISQDVPKKVDESTDKATFDLDVEIESIFKRNSGIWTVTRLFETEEERSDAPEQILYPENFQSPLLKLKKVKINTKLNSSQDVEEHFAKIRSSPAIPFDGKKRPSKPVLKTPTMTGPINPFYLV